MTEQLSLRRRQKRDRIRGVGLAEVLEQQLRDAGIEERLAGGHGAERCRDPRQRGGRQQEATGARADGVEHDPFLGLRAVEEAAAVGGERADLGAELHAAAAHVGVDERDIGLVFLDPAQRRLARGDDARDLEAGFAAEDRAEAGSHDLVIVHHEHADHGLTLH